MKLGVPLTVIFTRVAHKPVHNNGFGLLAKSLDNPILNNLYLLLGWADLFVRDLGFSEQC
jgi:hypothetical protein